ncbi:hypothetical protein [Zunongwangia atlantica]|uniref:GIY-YIG domain-containing protein n=1 Tax=Zunongwangia atlantica 22II14-10F7 TaxID=1185767 RepID=A0A1Y1T8F4_9FLAO|nr:hypothetical protein [Zunongwangia atlantica]ORL47329.1 hypothetical protein IIF7_01170 [Zunongwangia atlantica 22II14-10F7]
MEKNQKNVIMIDWKKQKEYSKKLLENTIKLIDKIEVESTTFSLEINSTSLKESSCDINELVEYTFSKIDFDPIYCIQLIDENCSKEIGQAFDIAKKNKIEGRCYSKYNKRSSKTLYVGISQEKSFQKRMREHLGAGSKSTYALNLQYWIPDNIQIKISVFKPNIPEYDKKEHLNLMELLEQSLWDKLEPMMGKRSGQL